MKKARFNPKEIRQKPTPLDNYIESYIIISSSNGNSEAGKLIGFINGYAYLHPFVCSDYTSEKGPIRSLIEDTMAVNMQPHFSVAPTTKKSLENYCISKNNEET